MSNLVINKFICVSFVYFILAVGCEGGEYQCNNGRCIDERRKCDTRDDCGDNSDEADCGK